MKLKKGKSLCFFSAKGGVGKTVNLINLAGIFQQLDKKVLIIDLDLYAGGIATILNVDNKKDIYMLVDSISNNRFTSLRDYVCTYNNGIDVLAAPKDPRDVSKIESKYINKIFDIAKMEYDVILVDTHHLMDEMTLVALDASDMSAFIVTNDLVDLKNMKTLVSIFNESKKDNYKIVCATYKDGEIYLDEVLGEDKLNFIWLDGYNVDCKIGDVLTIKYNPDNQNEIIYLPYEKHRMKTEIRNTIRFFDFLFLLFFFS